jgi:hypothetical protein
MNDNILYIQLFVLLLFQQCYLLFMNHQMGKTEYLGYTFEHKSQIVKFKNRQVWYTTLKKKQASYFPLLFTAPGPSDFGIHEL